MSTVVMPRLICCDEAGFTGNDMLNPDQPYFAYASHDLSLSEAEALLSRARKEYPVQMPELKSKNLLKTKRGRALLDFVLERIEGRYIATVYDKRLSLTCKLFEYIYEPVLQENNILFYRNNLHRFVGMYLYIQFASTPMKALAAEFEAFMRSLDPADAPTLFGQSQGTNRNQLIDQIIRFAQGYNVRIAQETRSLHRSQTGKWMLDLTSAAVFSQLAAWGDRHPLIEVVCDESKPLLSLANMFDAMVNRPERVRVDAFGKQRPITWNMAKSLAFASSHGNAGIQLADLIAGVTAVAPLASNRPELQPLTQRIAAHLHEDCILPDFDVLDLSGDEAPVNWLVLEELACRADNGADPLDGMEIVYEYARRSLPEFRAAIASR